MCDELHMCSKGASLQRLLQQGNAKKTGFAAQMEMKGSHQDVVGLDVSMQHAAIAQVVQGRQHLRRVSAHRRNVEADAAAVLLRQLPQVDVLRDRS